MIGSSESAEFEDNFLKRAWTVMHRNCDVHQICLDLNEVQTFEIQSHMTMLGACLLVPKLSFQVSDG